MELELLAMFLRREHEAPTGRPAVAALFARDESGRRLLDVLRSGASTVSG